MEFARDALGAERTAGLRLEEVESGSGEWRITLSMISDASDLSPLPAALTSPAKRRHYKVFTVKKADGEVVAMNIREVAT
jgi:hypothetical protein